MQSIKPFSVNTAGQEVFLRIPISLFVQLHVQYLHEGIERFPVILRDMLSSVNISASFFEFDEAFLETKTLKPFAVPHEPFPEALLWIDTNITFLGPTCLQWHLHDYTV